MIAIFIRTNTYKLNLGGFIMSRKRRFDKFVSFLVTQKQYDGLEKIADEDLADKSFVLRRLLNKELERRGIK